MICAYKNCLHETNKISDDEEYIKEKSTYYHLDCYDCRRKINEIITIFAEQVNSNIVFTVLRRVINTLVFKQNNDVNFVLYAIKYAVNHPEMKLTNPEGLYRICKDKNVVDSWNEIRCGKLLDGKKVEIKSVTPTSFELPVAKKKKSISDLF